jgi:hypothetical protein
MRICGTPNGWPARWKLFVPIDGWIVPLRVLVHRWRRPPLRHRGEAVTIVRWGAETQGNSSEARALAGNVRRTKRRLADHHDSEFRHYVPTRHWNVARSELAEGLHYSPNTVLRTCVNIALRRNGTEK